MALTPKQEAFALAYVETGNASEASPKYYVYHLIDPRSKKVFYVGKGTGNRIAHHERDAAKLRFANSEKEATILDIWSSGAKVTRKIVDRFQLEAAAFAFEKAEIERIGIENLTNLAKGGEPDAVKALRRGEAFIRRLSQAIPTLPQKSAEEARGLIREMEENLTVCRGVLAGGAAG